MNPPCPDEADLMSYAQGTSDAAIAAHVESCARCRRAVVALRSEVSTLRLAFPARSGQSVAVSSGSVPTRPAFIGKYFIAGTVEETEAEISYRAAHAVLHQEVILTIAKAVTVPAAERGAWTNTARGLVEFVHKNFGRVYDFEFHEDHPFLVEEHVNGLPADVHAAEHRPAERDCSEWMSQLSDAIAAARAAGLVWNWRRLQPVVVDGATPRLVGLAAGWLDVRTNPNTSIPSTIDTQRADVQELGQWFARLLIARHSGQVPSDATVANPKQVARQLLNAGGSKNLARLVVDCIASDQPSAPRSAAELHTRLEQRLHARYGTRGALAAAALAGLSIIAWLLFG